MHKVVHPSCLSHTQIRVTSLAHAQANSQHQAQTQPHEHRDAVHTLSHDRKTLSANTEGTQVDATMHCTWLSSRNSLSSSRLSRYRFARHGCQDKPRRACYTAVALRPATNRCGGHATSLM